MTTPRLDPPRPATAPEEPAPTAARGANAGDRFFSWTAGLGLVRGDGWIGGVAAGIAARLRIDPLIVRGILVVVGLFGFPVVFLYALAWAVLPDLDGRMPLQDALRRHFEPAQVGILGLMLVGLIPLGPGLVLVGGIPQGMLTPGLGGWSALSALLVGAGLVIAAVLLFIILRAARHSARPADPGVPRTQRTASAADAAPDVSAAATGSGPVAAADAQGTDAAGFAASAPAFSAEFSPGLSPEDAPRDAGMLPQSPSEPSETHTLPRSLSEAGTAEPKRPHPTDDDAYAAWREQHAAWKVQDDAWRRQQQDADRAVREQARRERQERAAAFAAEAAERRRLRRVTKPRTPLSAVAVVIGVALIAGTATALWQRDVLAPARGLFVAALVFGLSMVVAGALRRRSGFLAFATVVTLLAAGTAATVPVVQTLHLGTYWLAVGDSSQPPTSASDPFVQQWGDLTITALDDGVDGTVYVKKGSGSTQIMPGPLDASVRMDIDIITRDAVVDSVDLDGRGAYGYSRLDDVDGVATSRLADGRTRFTAAVGPADARTHHRIVIEQDSGFISVMRPASASSTGGSR